MKKLLAAIDFSKTTNTVLDQASKLAKALSAKLWIVHVASGETLAMAYESPQISGDLISFGSMPGDIEVARKINAQELRREHSELLAIAADLRQKHVDVQVILLQGNAAKLIVEKANELGTEMILLGSHGHGLLHKALLGSVSESIIRHASCSVMVVPSPDKQL